MIHNLINAWAHRLLRAHTDLVFFAHSDPTDSTLLLCGWEISQMLLRVGWLARIPLCFWAHTDLTFFSFSDLTDPTVSLCGWVISQMILRVWTCVGSDRGTLLSLSRTYLSDPSDKSDLSDLSDLSDKLDIFKNNP